MDVYLETIRDRLINGITTIPIWADWQYGFVLISIYTIIALCLGFCKKFLKFKIQSYWQISLKIIATSFVAPGLLEELFFRGLLLPHPTENSDIKTVSIYIIISLLLFVVYHPLNAITFFPAGRKSFFDPVFLCLATLLGIICTLVYLKSGSIWIPVLIHWLIVVVWLLCLGGAEKLKIIEASNE